MTVLTVRNLDDDTRDALKWMGAEHGRSMEGEARAILTAAVRGHRPLDESSGLGTRISALFADADWPGSERADGPAEAASFAAS